MKSPEFHGLEAVSALHIQPDGTSRPVEDDLAVEGALQIRVNGAPYSVTMRTPGDDALLALGLLFTEGLLQGKEDLIAAAEKPSAIEGVSDRVDLEIHPAALAGKNLANRRLDSNSSCGVCGKISAEDLVQPERAVTGDGRLDLSLLPGLEGRMRAAQALFSRTGGSHAAAAFDLSGNLLVIKEDVGRHNAVDKVIGWLLREGRLEEASVLFISGRVSYEIVTKASRAGIAFLLAVSAPSSLAVKLCREAGITLLAFCRGGKATVYSHPERVAVAGPNEASAIGLDETMARSSEGAPGVEGAAPVESTVGRSMVAGSSEGGAK